MTRAGHEAQPAGPPRTEQDPAVTAGHNPAAEGRGRRIGADVLLLVAAVVAAACSYSTTGRFFNQIAVGAGAVAVLCAILAGWQPAAFRRGTVVIAVIISVGVQLYKPPIGNVQRVWGFHGVLAVTALATAAIAVLAMLPASRRRLLPVGLTMAVLGLTELAIVAWSHRPEIDVWQIFQQASAGLLHGVNPYAISYTHIPAGQTASCFNYLPVTLLSAWPGWAIFNDVRYSEVAVLLLGWAVLARTVAVRAVDPGRRYDAFILLALAMSLTGTLRVGQQAWNESLLLGFMLLGCCALISGRTVWAVVLFGLALATKQHIALLLPVLMMWRQFGWRRTVAAAGLAAAISAPWFFADPHRFKGCTVDFFTHGIARFDSISLWHFLPSPIAPAVPVLALLAGYWLVYRRIGRSPGGLLVGFAGALYAFDLFNKQSFENQWWFVCELLVCGVALSVAGIGEPGPRTEPEPVPAAAD
ncbi:MAG TPA: glycosyltransferase family 87 protein [Jatrophihabitans sp.]|nr:glycosyltransferase family 87 protein [Jatrophihabitans sp.]